MRIRAIHDLTHPIRDGQPGWPGDPPTRIVACEVPGDDYRLARIEMGEHSGTHLGAPSHYGYAGTLSDLPAAAMAGRLLVLLHAQLESMPEDLPAADTVIVSTGWAASHWGTPAYFAGVLGDGSDIPGIAPAVAERIIARTGCRILGIDGPSLDPGGVHGRLDCGRLVASRGVFHLENCATVPPLPKAHSTVVVAPLSIESGSGAPCRVLIIEYDEAISAR